MAVNRGEIECEGDSVMYTPEELEKIKRVLDVFQEFIRQASDFDIVYSEKVGYLLLEGGRNLDGFMPEPIPSAEYLCLRMFDKIADEHQNRYGYPKTRWNVPEEEKEAVLKQIRLYSAQLPEYQHLEEKVFRQSMIDRNMVEHRPKER